MPKTSGKKFNKHRFDQCSNPHNVLNHSKKRATNLRKISKEQLLAWNMPINDETLQVKICNTCRLRKALPSISRNESENDDHKNHMEAVSSAEPNLSPTDTSNEENTESSESTELSIGEKDVVSTVVGGVNNGLAFLGLSPIQTKKLSLKKYATHKIDSISNALQMHIFNTNHENLEKENNEHNEESYLPKILQEKFSSTIDRSKQIQILTILHQWPYSKIIKHFPTATRHMIEVAKKTAQQKEILEGPNPKSHPSLEESVINKVLDFYQSDEYSRVMPGQKDYVSVKIDGERHHIQKRLLLLNLKELHRAFINNNPEIECSFSKFASLRPKQCILAGARGTHSVCVCAIHENVKLLIKGVGAK